MKTFRFAIILFAFFGIVSTFVPVKAANDSKFVDFYDWDPLQVFGVLGAFAFASIIGILGVALPRFGRVAAILATIAFVAGAVFLTAQEPWRILEGFARSPIPAQMMVGSILAGAAAGVVAAIGKPERRPAA